MSELFISKKENTEQFWEFWNNFVSQNGVSPRYLRLSIENFLEISRYRELLKDDRSFVYVVDGKVLGCAFLPVEVVDGKLAIAHDGGYVNGPLFVSPEAGKKIFGKVEEIAKAEGFAKVMFQIDSSENKKYPYNHLQKFDYLDTSIITYIIDLTLPGDLMSHCRNGHKSDIKKILNNPDYELFVVDSEDANYALHEEYRELHRKCSGRVTRSKASFDSQFERLKVGNALLVGLRYKGETVAYSYFEMNGTKAIYASSADDPRFERVPLYHVLLFRAMSYLKEKGFAQIDASQPVSPSHQYDWYPTEKQKNIALFKRGFGGRFEPHYRGVKYYDRVMFERDVEKFKLEYKC